MEGKKTLINTGRMSFDGNLDIFKKLAEKRDLLKQNDDRHKEIRPLLIVMPGLMRGVAGGGRMEALHEAGFNNIFDNVIGISTGAPAAAYFLANQPKTGTSIYYDDLPKGNFISLRRGLSGGNMVDINLICDIFRGKKGEKKLNIQKLLQNRTQFHVGITEYDTGVGVLKKADKTTDLVELIRASTAVPVLYDEKVLISGKRYVDGCVGISFPTQEIIKKLNPTDVMVLTNKNKIFTQPLIHKRFDDLYKKRLPTVLYNKLKKYVFLTSQEMKKFQENAKYNHLILWENNERLENSMNGEKLKENAGVAYEHTKRLILNSGTII